MKKFDRFLIILYLSLIAIISTGVIIFTENYLEKVSFGIMLIIWILAINRSYHLENYLRQLDAKEKLNLFEHLTGVLNNWKKMVGLVVMIKPILDKNEFSRERKRINLLTVLLYFSILSFVILIINI